MRPTLQLRIGQQLTMTPQLQQAIKLLQLSTLELQQEIQEVLESNPLLEVNEQQEAILKVSAAVDNPLDILFSSAAEVFEQNTTGVLLTGIGDDGSEGFRSIREKLGATIAQNSNTCVYPNLAQCAIERGLVDKIVVEKELANEIEAVIRKQENNS